MKYSRLKIKDNFGSGENLLENFQSTCPGASELKFLVLREGYLIQFTKKGDLSNCSNYRGITLLSVLGKVFNRIILETPCCDADSFPPFQIMQKL